jgi:hypothetical protein
LGCAEQDIQPVHPDTTKSPTIARHTYLVDPMKPDAEQRPASARDELHSCQ